MTDTITYMHHEEFCDIQASLSLSDGELCAILQIASTRSLRRMKSGKRGINDMTAKAMLTLDSCFGDIEEFIGPL